MYTGGMATVSGAIHEMNVLKCHHKIESESMIRMRK
jgi:hypothetical protein